MVDDGRGRNARAPSQIPPRGWLDIAIRTVKEFLEDEAPRVAAGVTFYSLLALFPGIGAFVALWGLFGDLSGAQQDLQSLAVILPGGAITIIGAHMTNVAAANHGGLSFAALGGLIVSIWSANGATKAMMAGVGLAYEEKEKQGFLRKTLTSLAFTAGFLLFVMTLAAALVARPAIDHFAGHDAAFLFTAVSWAVLFVPLRWPGGPLPLRP